MVFNLALASGGSAYKYYDTPDGQDLIKKTWWALRNVIPVSAAYATLDVMAVAPRSYLSILDRFIRVAGPPVVCTVMFTTTVFAATNFRKKDDITNHILGCVPVVYYLNRLQKASAGFMPVALFGVLCVAIVKDSKLTYNTLMHPDHYNDEEEIESTVFEYYNQYSLWSQRPRGWVKAEEVAAGKITE